MAAFQAATTLARAAPITAAVAPAASQAQIVAKTSPAAKTVAIPTESGRELGARLYAHPFPVAALIVHGATAVPQRFYEPFAQAMAEFGFAVLTYDYRGVGASADRPLADDPTTMTDWVDDAAAAQTWLVETLPDLPLLVVGHSFGGQFAATLEEERPADALVLVGAQSGYFGSFAPVERGKLWLTWKLGIPALTTAFGYLPGWAGLGEDLPSGVARQWARWCSSPDYMLSELPELERPLASYRGRVLALSFTDDDFAPRANVEWLNSKLKSAELVHRHLEPAAVGLPEVGHFGLFRKRSRQALWSLVAAFLLDVAYKRRSGRPRDSLLLQEIMADLQYGR